MTYSVSPKKTLWQESPVLHNYSSTCLWTLKVHWAHYIKEKYSLFNQSCLSIGCGTGQLERGLLQHKCVKSIDVFCVNPTSVKEAQRKAIKEGFAVSHFSGDANTIVLRKEKITS